ncbi:MAG: hypothetical protein O3A39_04120 [Proteobacteria bacterium]|nr:hypothetical protein [Pseudomonadota bacterium]
MIYSLVDTIKKAESNFDCENSYLFLRDYILYKQWNVFSTKNYSFDVISQLRKYFVDSHGQIFLNESTQNNSGIWSSAPLGIFRYRMDSNNFWQEIGYLNKIKGYIIEGAYWNNGFFYHVTDNETIIEINLFIDETTLIRYNYPYTPHKSI